MVEECTERELDVIQHITDHPGITKEDLVQELKGQYSRVTLFNVLKNLQEQKIIYIEKDQNNWKIHHLFASKGNIIANQLHELDEFEKAFITLLERIKQEVSKVYPKFKEESRRYLSRSSLRDMTTSDGMDEILNGSEFKKILEPYALRKIMFVQCIYIFRQLLLLYMVRSIFEWPLRIEDPKKLDEITLALFRRLINIQLKITKIMSKETVSSQDNQSKSKDAKLTIPYDVSSDIIRQMLEDWKKIENIEKYVKEYGLEKEIKPVVELLSNIRDQVKELPFLLETR